MVSWLAKALVQKGIGALPNPHYWNEFLQNRLTRSLDLTDERFEEGLRNCQNHLKQRQRFGPPTVSSGFSVFELGTGWFPTVAIAFFLCGAREVWTWDIAPFLTRDRLKTTLRRFLELEQADGLTDHFHVPADRLRRLEEVMALCDRQRESRPTELLERLGIHYRIGNAGRSDLPAHSIDLIVSDVVFEYLSPQQLSEVLQEFRRIAVPNAVMSHTIGLGDQYAAHDSRITPFNFLRFSDRTWRWLNNPIIPLNRLRLSDYRRVVGESGFQIVDETSRRGDPGDLARTRLAARFRTYTTEDLLVIFTCLVAIPRPS